MEMKAFSYLSLNAILNSKYFIKYVNKGKLTFRLAHFKMAFRLVFLKIKRSGLSSLEGGNGKVRDRTCNTVFMILLSGSHFTLSAAGGHCGGGSGRDGRSQLDLFAQRPGRLKCMRPCDSSASCRCCGRTASPS